MEAISSSGSAHAGSDAPRGFFRVSVDEKGRIKFPAAIFEYWQGLDSSKVFITTLDIKELRIYPLPRWKEAEEFLQEPGDDYDDRRDVTLIAYAYGKDDEIDGHGRLTLPSELRKELGLEKKEVRVWWYKGHLKMVLAEELDRRLTVAKVNLDTKANMLEKKGL